MARELIESIEAEYRRYEKLGADAVAQLSAPQLSVSTAEGSNSIATIVWHIAGNLTSRFTDFLTSDGEKPWRDRESEFDDRQVGHDELIAKWTDGWSVLYAALRGLTDEDLNRTVTIREQPLKVHEALHRSLAHTAYHVGQIVFHAKTLRGGEWKSLSIPRGKSADYNQKPTLERPPR